MKKDFLIDLGISEEVASKIMAENGKDIQREQNKFADYEDLKKSLATSKEQLEKLHNMKPEEMEKEIFALKEQLEKNEQEANRKLAEMETVGRIKDFLSPKKFVNDFTKDAISGKIKDILSSEESKGKSLDDIYTEITKDLKGIEIDDSKPKPPTGIIMNGENAKTDDSAIRAIMGLAPKK